MDIKAKLSVSMMCANLLNLEKDIRLLESLQVDYLHIDIMDADFVPNITFGIDTVNRMREITTIPFDIHLLVNYPLPIIRSLQICETDIVTIHKECKDNIMDNIAFIKKQKAKFGIALNPETQIEEIYQYLPYLDTILLMLIIPGFAGSTMIHGIMDKIAYANQYLLTHKYENIEIAVDGSVSCEKAIQMKQLGASIFVGGTTAIFREGKTLQETVENFYKVV
jgi:ribulose-phosphate 3-epimerase